MAAAAEKEKKSRKKSSKKKSREDKHEIHPVDDVSAAMEEEKSRKRNKSKKKSKEDKWEQPLPSADAQHGNHAVEDASAAAEEEKSRKKKSSKKRPRKDKWGQPMPSSEDGTYTVDDTVAAVEEQQDEGGGKGIEHEARKVVASGIPYFATEDDIRAVFEGVGPVVQLQLTRFPDTGNFRGLAFVTFKTSKDATEALKLDGTNMSNRSIKVERCRANPERKRKREFLSDPDKVEGCYTAYIGNLSLDVTEDDLRGLFDASRIASIRFATNKRTGKFRGFGHIDFEDDDSLEKAISKNQAELRGRPIKIAYAASNRT